MAGVSTRARMPSPFHPASEEAKTMIRAMVMDSYDWFVDLVAELERRVAQLEQLQQPLHLVELEDGIEGLIHISQISQQRIDNPREVLSEGQEVTARVLDVNPAERRMRLSLRPAHEEPSREAGRGEDPGKEPVQAGAAVIPPRHA